MWGDHLIPVGPGVRHPEDGEFDTYKFLSFKSPFLSVHLDPAYPQSVRAFKPMKEGKYVETSNHIVGITATVNYPDYG